MADIDILGAHTDGTLIATDQAQAEDTSNSLDNLLANAHNKVIEMTITGNAVVADDDYFGASTIKLTGTPAGNFALDLPDGDRIIRIWNTTGKIATIDTVTGASKTVAVEDGKKVTFQVDGTEFELIGTSSFGFHILNLTSLRRIVSNDIDTTANNGGILTVDTSPKLKRVNGATDKALVVEWLGGSVDEVQFDPYPIPPDLDSDEDLTIHLLPKMSAGGDTPTIDIQVFDAIGDTEMGGPTAALSSTLAELTVTIASANISGHPLGFLNISLVPGAHATQLIELYAAWIEYVRK